MNKVKLSLIIFMVGIWTSVGAAWAVPITYEFLETVVSPGSELTAELTFSDNSLSQVESLNVLWSPNSFLFEFSPTSLQILLPFSEVVMGNTAILSEGLIGNQNFWVSDQFILFFPSTYRGGSWLRTIYDVPTTQAPAQVPEPGILILMGVGVVGLIVWKRKVGKYILNTGDLPG